MLIWRGGVVICSRHGTSPARRWATARKGHPTLALRTHRPAAPGRAARRSPPPARGAGATANTLASVDAWWTWASNLQVLLPAEPPADPDEEDHQRAAQRGSGADWIPVREDPAHPFWIENRKHNP